MALLGRGQPPHPHVAAPLVSAGGPVPLPWVHPVVVDAGPLLRGFWHGNGRNRVIAAHLAVAIISAGGPVKIPAPHVVEVRAASYQRGFWAGAGRSVVLRPHLAPANLQPSPFPPAKVVSTADQRSRTGWPAPTPHLSPPLVAPGGPVRLPWVHPVVVDGAGLLRQSLPRPVPRPHLAPAVLTTPGPAFVAPAPTVVAQARRVGVRGAPKPHLSGAVVDPNGPVRLPRVVPFVYDQPALFRPLVGRTVPRPHLAAANLAPAPFPAAVVVTTQTLRRTRPTLRPHLAKPVLASLAAPLSPAVIVAQSLRRALTGRTVPRAHLVPPNLTPPVPPPVGAGLVAPTEASGQVAPTSAAGAVAPTSEAALQGQVAPASAPGQVAPTSSPGLA